MPELPEVQTIVNDLRGSIRGWTVADFSSVWKKNVSPSFAQVRKKIIGRKIEDVKREGKYILIELDNGNVIVIHLRMTGSLIAQVKSSKLKIKNYKHTRHWWILKKEKKEMKLLFSDVRKFATVDLVTKGEKCKVSGLNNLGVDPLDARFTPELLGDIFHAHPKRIVRNVLLDQNLIGGIGNIYVSEILFDAKVLPTKEVGGLKRREVSKIRASIKKILEKAIKLRGTTFSDYRDSKGEVGGFQNMLKVYNRECEKCPRKGCDGVILKEKIQGRSAFWCSKCQR